MELTYFKKINIWSIAICGIAVALFITPSTSTEPVDMPKMTLLVTFAFGMVGMALINLRSLFANINKWLLVIAGLFLFQMSLVLIFSGAPFGQQFFGTFGRNTGFLSYLSLLILLLVTSGIADGKLNSVLSKSLLVIGLISIFYDLLQTFNFDPIKWNNPYNSIIGFLGNPDFESSFLGICATVAFSIILKEKFNWSRRVFFALYFAISVFLILRSHAQQGLLVLGIGVATVLAFFIKGNKKLNTAPIKSIYFGVFALIATVVVLGTLKIGPLGSHLYKLSVRQRGFYWHAAIQMIKHHPFFGVGFDSYGDWYFTYRSQNAAFHTPTTQSNAAHNVFLDIGASGGIFLLVLNLGMTLLAIIAILKVWRRTDSYNWCFAGLVGAWIAYEAQSLVSINQLGLAIWGWILMGVVIGFEYKTRIRSHESGESLEIKSTKRKARKRRDSGGGRNILAGSIGLISGAILVLPYFYNDHNYRVSTSTRSAQQIYSATLKSPEDIGRTLMAAQLFANSKLNTQAIELTKHVLNINPRSYNGWILLSQITIQNSPDYKLAMKKVRDLDPKGITK